jgi:hypothetical protein
MAFTFELTSDAAPDVVLDAIAHRATYWRESQVPAELRSRGVFGVSGRVKHNTFYLACDNMGTSRRAWSTEVPLAGPFCEHASA